MRTFFMVSLCCLFSAALQAEAPVDDRAWSFDPAPTCAQVRVVVATENAPTSDRP